ncbi:MAG TPA: RsmD family RNA methyltransferase [Acidobacteriaceae bacterium]
MSENKQVHVGRAIYGGNFVTSDPDITLPFVLRKETVEVSTDGKVLRILEAAVERVAPRCPHFGTCGGCQYQMVNDQEQLTLKREVLYTEFQKAGVAWPDDVPAHYAEPYGYRNRIRLRIERVEGIFRFGYNIRATTEFLPITTCPISAPNLIPTVEALLDLASEDRDVEYWLDATAELELFTNDDLSRVQLTLFVAPRTKAPQGSFIRMINALQQRAPQVAGAAAAAFDPRTGPTGRILAEHGASGLNYKVGDETYWISRGGFFQVNRFLIVELVKLVTDNRSGNIAWDLFAGVGLFSRVLARNFTQVTAVESSRIASADLAAAFKKLGPQHRVVSEPTLAFLQKAITQRERPDFIVLDPPRAGTGLEVCALLTRIAAPQIVYVSCDPTTLARDLAALQPTYRIDHLHVVDLFPQTFHIETVAFLTRTKPSLRSTL